MLLHTQVRLSDQEAPKSGVTRYRISGRFPVMTMIPESCSTLRESDGT